MADPSTVRRAAARLVRLEGRAFVVMLVLNVLGAGAGLVTPWLVGRIVDEVRAGAGVDTIDRLALAIVAAAVGQVVLVRYARLVGHRFGERTSARIRETFVDRALHLPTSVVERAGTGDLTARGSADVQRVSVTLRDAGPDVLIAAVQALLFFGAIFVLHPLLGVCGLAGLAGTSVALRWYLLRARAAYLDSGAADSVLADVVASTASGARTVEAFRLQEQRMRACEHAIGRCRHARLRTLSLRSVLFPAIDASHVVPVAGVLLVGGVLLQNGAISLGTVVAAALYLRQLVQPLDTILLWAEQLQSSAASFARVEGVAAAVRTAQPPLHPPVGERIVVDDVSFAYGGGPDVLRDVDLAVQPGERLAIVGPSGAGKTTLGRLLAGIDRPRTGTVTVGDVPVWQLDPDELRRHVVLVTQEHHVFLGTVRDNLLIAAQAATDGELDTALASVSAHWVHELPDGLGTELGDGHRRLDDAQVQQIALARVVLADPHTVVLDEATAMLDPTTARQTERALAAVLRGRTVITIAHRLHTARDADRVAVMDDGRLIEVGTHDELVACGGTYAALWRAWEG